VKKFLLVPLVAVVAAAGAASAAGFAGGVSAGPLQVGQTSDLECAKSAEIVEWGYNDHTAVPDVVNVKVELRGANCAGEAVNVIPLNADGTQMGAYRAAGRVPAQDRGVQTVRLQFNTAVPAEALKSVRVSIDPGYDGLAEGSQD
jgi:hypothetical protein